MWLHWEKIKESENTPTQIGAADNRPGSIHLLDVCVDAPATHKGTLVRSSAHKKAEFQITTDIASYYMSRIDRIQSKNDMVS